MPRRETLPDGTERIHFDAPILEVDHPRRHVDFRPPMVIEVLRFGDPATAVFGPDGTVMATVDRDLLLHWVRTLMVGHDLDILGRERGVELGRMIEAVILDFFRKTPASFVDESARSPASAPSTPSAA